MTTSASSPGSFRSPEQSFRDLHPDVAARLISAAADVALVLDDQGIIRDQSMTDTDGAQVPEWIGQAWIETVAPDSRSKVETILSEIGEGRSVRSREINHRLRAGRDLPIRYTAVRLGDQGRVLAVGRDLRALSSLQQQLVGAQQSMEREYARLRHAETRYRLLFQIASEAVVIVDAQTLQISEANPSAGTLLEEPPRRIVGKPLSHIFGPEAWGQVRALLSEVKVAGWADDIRSRLVVEDREVIISASLFRHDDNSLFLVRLAPADERQPLRIDRDGAHLSEVVRRLPDAFIVVDEDRRILTANGAFLDLAQLATESQARKEPLDNWLGRGGGADLNILMATLKEHGTVRNFATIIRGHFGMDESVEVSGVSAMHGDQPCYGFIIRPLASRTIMETASGAELPRSVEQLTGLVGRVPLKEIVRETTDVIERLCIEAALEVSRDNRASAAQVLGLSRQSLYAKLRRHGLGDLDQGDKA